MQIRILGPFEVLSDDGVVADVPGARLRALLIALALEPGRVVPRATLVDWIWGEHPPADAPSALQRLASRLRKALPDGMLDGQTGGYRLTVDPDAVDAVRFERLVAQGRQQEALALWRGAALQDVGVADSDAFDAAGTRLEGMRLTATEERFAADVGPGHVAELTDLVAAHPLRERLVAALMRALVAAGRDSEALLVYQRTREALVDALGVDPSPELSTLHGALLRGELGVREENRRTNLRAELTSFVGRDADLAVVRDLVAGHRLTTLIGPGGSGKTRLATEAARTLHPPDGVWLVELAAVGADGDVAQATLAGLGLRDALLGSTSNADLTERLITAVRDREALLILDNCEHMIGSVAAFADRVLGECRRLRILATSREPLGITGEALWLVEPLAPPEAVRLLLDRAGAVRRDLAVDDHASETTMARICRALDGMPLAIELAAARLRTMSVDQLADRLHDRFRLLTGGSRTALPRHKTLRAMVDWSWELLTDAERTVLRRLSVFSGGAGLDAAERVCAGNGVEPEQVLELLTSLAEKSLVVTDGRGAPRYRMLTTITEYARQRLAEAGDSDLARRAHLDWFTELTETAEPHLRRAEQLEWLAVLGTEHDNIGSAMRGAVAAGAAAPAMRLAAAAGWYWWLSGHRAEGLELVTAATAMPGEVADETRALVYAIVVLFVSAGRGGENEAREWIHRAYRFSRRVPDHHPVLGLVAPLERMLQVPDGVLDAFEPLLASEDPWVRALARLHMGKMRVVLGHGGREADQYLETALAEFRVLGERYGISFALTELGERIAVRGEFARACGYFEQAIVVLIQVGAVEDIIRMRSRQAQLYWLLGDKDASADALADAERRAEGVTWPDALAELALAKADLARWSGDAQESRHQLDLATTLLGDGAQWALIRAVAHDLLGYLADDLDEARTHRAAACRAATESGYAPLVAQILVGVADLALCSGQDEQAVRLLAAATGVRGLPDHTHPDAARIEQSARSHLGEAAFAEAAREGAGTSWSDLVAVTLGP